jgi:hypothetical protein
MDPPIAGILLTVSYDLRVSNSHNLLPFETECADKIPSSDPANMTLFVTDIGAEYPKKHFPFPYKGSLSVHIFSGVKDQITSP